MKKAEWIHEGIIGNIDEAISRAVDELASAYERVGRTVEEEIEQALKYLGYVRKDSEEQRTERVKRLVEILKSDNETMFKTLADEYHLKSGDLAPEQHVMIENCVTTMAKIMNDYIEQNRGIYD